VAVVFFCIFCFMREFPPSVIRYPICEDGCQKLRFPYKEGIGIAQLRRIRAKRVLS
jgi:hypothetical protein